MTKDYKQIDCLFYDQITDVIVQKKSVRIDCKNEYGEFLQLTAIPQDIIKKDKMEYLVVNTSDELIRLDRLTKFDGIVPPHISGNYYQCDC